ncbi:MAG: preprotein translocase subunit SecE [Candidatus Electryoneaceae bacterium]|nr:preprotein translocase subunit SecE [Candidatus Electryoneaceae bacterium]
MINKAVKYIGDVRRETAKVLWPSWGELRESAVVVIVMTLLCAVFIFSVDFFLTNILKLII